MIHIRNRSDLKVAYEIIQEMQDLTLLPGREGETQNHIRKLKRDIRGFYMQHRLSES